MLVADPCNCCLKLRLGTAVAASCSIWVLILPTIPVNPSSGANSWADCMTVMMTCWAVNTAAPASRKAAAFAAVSPVPSAPCMACMALTGSNLPKSRTSAAANLASSPKALANLLCMLAPPTPKRVVSGVMTSAPAGATMSEFNTCPVKSSTPPARAINLPPVLVKVSVNCPLGPVSVGSLASSMPSPSAS